MNIEQAKGIAMTEILRKIGCRPVRNNASDIWYLSPFRSEKTASFKVNTDKNVWFDFGAGKGGNVIKFACEYLLLHSEPNGVSDALRWLGQLMPTTYSYIHKSNTVPEPVAAVPSLVAVKAYELQYRTLTNYVENRGIPLELAQEFLKEVLVRHRKTGREFFAIGLYTEAEGYELVTEDFKGTIGAKSISFIRGTKVPANEIHIFEGMMDFLSAVAEHPEQHFEGDIIVLNSVSCLPQVFPYIRNYNDYRKLTTWLDNDEAGTSATKKLKEFANIQDISFTAMNETYAPHKDVNEWHVHKAKPKP